MESKETTDKKGKKKLQESRYNIPRMDDYPMSLK